MGILSGILHLLDALVTSDIFFAFLSYTMNDFLFQALKHHRDSWIRNLLQTVSFSQPFSKNK